MNHPVAVSTSGEAYQLWRQLALAGLIEGTYTGIAGPTTGAYDAVVGTNVPKSKMTNAGWSEQAFGNYAGAYPTFYAGNFGNMLIFGAQNPGNSTFNAVLKPEEAWNIDTKIDDGKPGSGKVIAVYLNNTCTQGTSATDYTSPYNLSNSSVVCALFFTNSF